MDGPTAASSPAPAPASSPTPAPASSPAPPLQPGQPPQSAPPPQPAWQPAPQLPAQGAGWWPGYGGSNSINLPSPQGSYSPNPWYPASGFVNLLQRPQFPAPPPSLGENFHFVGVPQNLTPTSPPPPPCAKGTPTPPGTSTNRRVSIEIDDDDGVEASRTVKKRYWTHKEEVRLANAWLNASKDPIKGNDKKGDSFWKEVTEEFNKTAPPNCTRDTNQMKIHWSRLKTLINDFNGCWSTVTKVNKSGYSDDQLMDEAQKMYTAKHGKPFTLVHWWKALTKEPKWSAYVTQLDKEKTKSVTIDVTDDTEQSRPIGREAAKAQRNGKRKKEEVMDGIVLLGENINKIVEVQQERKVEREKVMQAQLEISRTNLKAAQEQKEARLLEVYNSLLKQDPSQLSEKAKANREKALEKMEIKLFGNDDES